MGKRPARKRQGRGAVGRRPVDNRIPISFLERSDVKRDLV